MDELQTIKAIEACKQGACSECPLCFVEDAGECVETLERESARLKYKHNLYEWVKVETRLPYLEEVDKDGKERRWVRKDVIVCTRRSEVFPAEYESVVIRGKRVRRFKWKWGNICDADIVAWAELPNPPEWVQKEGTK